MYCNNIYNIHHQFPVLRSNIVYNIVYGRSLGKKGGHLTKKQSRGSGQEQPKAFSKYQPKVGGLGPSV